MEKIVTKSLYSIVIDKLNGTWIEREDPKKKPEYLGSLALQGELSSISLLIMVIFLKKFPRTFQKVDNPFRFCNNAKFYIMEKNANL